MLPPSSSAGLKSANLFRLAIAHLKLTESEYAALGDLRTADKSPHGHGLLGTIRQDNRPGDTADDLAWMPLGAKRHGKITWFAP